MSDPTDTEQTEQRTAPPPTTQPALSVASTGPGQQIFKLVTQTVTDDELVNNLTAIKLIIDRLYAAEAHRDEYKQFVTAYYASNNQVGMLKVELRTNLANEIMFGAGLTLGGAVIGLVPYFWAKDNDHLAGGICIAGAILLFVGAIVGRLCYGLRK
jgi:VIT1/CCC1 family predicted Fe2+/Mn2+ transporter